MFLLHNDRGVTFNLSQLTDYLNLFIKQNGKKVQLRSCKTFNTLRHLVKGTIDRNCIFFLREKRKKISLDLHDDHSASAVGFKTENA